MKSIIFPDLQLSQIFRLFECYKWMLFSLLVCRKSKRPTKRSSNTLVDRRAGCSSLGGFWTENGPYRVKSDGETLFEDPYSWNSLGNILYLESPVGVGSSYQENNDLKTDDMIYFDNF